MTSATRAQCRDIPPKRTLEAMLESEYFPQILGLAVTNFIDMLQSEGIPEEEYRQRVAGACQLIFTLGWDQGYCVGKDDFENAEELCPDCQAETVK